MLFCQIIIRISQGSFGNSVKVVAGLESGEKRECFILVMGLAGSSI